MFVDIKFKGNLDMLGDVVIGTGDPDKFDEFVGVITSNSRESNRIGLP